ncbi:MAG: cbb3-type cytochrome c oxidase subunit II, partial [Bdellovibrionota bacterium]
PNSIMPSYPWLFQSKIDFDGLKKKLEVMQSLGVPYLNEEIHTAALDARIQARKIAEALAKDTPIKELENREIVAMIAYLQRLGKNPKLFTKDEKVVEVTQ